jgi:hypothetical protein
MEHADKLEEMILLQQNLNNDTNGKYWPLGKSSNGKIINWKRCIYMETAELIDSYPWKHWKNVNAEVDNDNIKIELVDIWHFLLSEILKKNNIISTVKLFMLFHNNKFFLGENFHEKGQPPEGLDLKKALSDLENNEPKEYAFSNSDVSVYEEIIHLCSNPVNDCKFDFIMTELFFKACAQENLLFDELYKTYIGKNCLNKFRQDNGYKEGTYKKMWDGVEDNMVLLDCLEELNTSLSFDSLYSILEKKYSEIKGN